MSANYGAWPVNTSTPVGVLREMVGDIDGEPLAPPNDGTALFPYFSDLELEALYEAADQSVTRATGLAYRRIAVYLTIEATDIQSDDLRIRTIERAKAMRELANDYINDAAADDERAGAEIFGVVPYVRPEVLRRPPEASQWPHVGPTLP